jgi:hypothetical protein
MYIEIHSEEQVVLMGKKLTRSLNYRKGHPAFLQIVELRSENTFAIVRREPADTFKTQCCMVHQKGRRGKFNLTVPSVEYICAIMDIPQFTCKVFKVEKCTAGNGLIYFKIRCK